MFAKSGEITAPCGVPSVPPVHAPSSMTPAFSHLATSRSTRRSPIRCSRNRIIQSWLMQSKKDRMSASRTQFTCRRLIP